MERQEVNEFFSTELLAWYRQIKRDLPWRMNRDPYRVWVSEIMLQQTRVDTVIPYYNTFMNKFPTVKALAEAPETEVLKCWEGLGYYSRARNLQAGAREVTERYDGIVPDDKASVAGLKGVGPYTTGAIMSIAFNRPEPAVDGNVMRVLSRYFCLEDDIAKPSTRVSIEKLAASLIPEGAAGDFNQALMELGALVCTPKSPGCLPSCPVMEHCTARLEGKEHELPVKTKAKPPRPEFRAAAIVAGSGEHAGKVLVRQRPATGLLAQMWELPHLLLPKDKAGWLAEHAPKEQGELAAMIGQMLEEDTGLLIRPRSWFTDADHIFSHIHWKMRFYLADLGEASGMLEEVASAAEYAGIAAEAASEYNVTDKLASHYRWIGLEDMETLPFPNLFLRILKQYWE
ncbi:A/G-specific adenine glycosylase [Paenibacillus alkaliterrae]|uniref:A/G-specific adenine glycosylase n=1 Tax=Paenibacillus alkaliterrae TaxID=320909 RepID=UPI001F3727E3|nr:A/G-specific adenine glycosylase [Paenibacillus alkaliterrae]MCF2937740.1 A/G-specific adenine glycosylase [Paenibacillus alkaliterrae]